MAFPDFSCPSKVIKSIYIDRRISLNMIIHETLYFCVCIFFTIIFPLMHKNLRQTKLNVRYLSKSVWDNDRGTRHS